MGGWVGGGGGLVEVISKKNVNTKFILFPTVAELWWFHSECREKEMSLLIAKIYCYIL
jgi:hypothetical protein